MERAFAKTQMVREVFRGGITPRLVQTLNVLFVKIPSAAEAIQVGQLEG